MRHPYYFVLLACLAAAGCQSYSLPNGFVAADPQSGEQFRAVSAEGSALRVRTETNPQNADLAFWEKAITTRLVDVRGYKLDSSREIQNHRAPGRELLLKYTRKGSEFTYVVAFFVTGGQVRVFEAAGASEQMTRDLPGIRTAIQSWPL